jgi:heavy metal translocating P-type ATPase
VTAAIQLVVGGVKIVRRDQIFKMRARSIVPGRQRWDIGMILCQPSVAEVLEAELRASPGIVVVHANPVTGRLLIYHDMVLNGEEVGQRVREATRQVMASMRSVRLTACPATERVRRHHDVAKNLDLRRSQTYEGQLAKIDSGRAIEIADDERKLNQYIAAAAVSMGMAIVGSLYPPLFPLTVASAVYAGMRIFKSGYKALVHEGKLRLDVVGSLYLTGAFIGGFYFPASFGLCAYYLSEKLVLITQDRSRQSLINIFGEQPRTVWQRVDDVEVEVPLQSVQAGDTLVIQAGQVVPVDGAITEGVATVDQHSLTGESQPVEKRKGDAVLASTLVTAGRIFVRVEKAGPETTAGHIGAILNKTASYQASMMSKSEQLADRWAPPTLALALAALPVAGYEYMVAVLGSTIGLNIKLTGPIALHNFLNVAADHGILVKDGRSLELLKDVDTVVFDKTGTLTLDEPHIVRIHTCANLGVDSVLMYAAAAEHRQTHPIARAILTESAARGISLPPADHVRYEMGYGLKVWVEGRLIRVGSEHYMALKDIVLPAGIRGLVPAAHGQGHSLVMVAVNDGLVGVIELEPTLRPEAEAVVGQLRRRNLDICIISGDREGPTRKVADALGITRYFANILPQEKATLVGYLQSEGRSVCFVGDGINDGISMKKANVSVSLRGASTVATDAAQIVLMSEGLLQLPLVFQLADEFDSNMRAGSRVAVGQGFIIIAGALISVVGIVAGKLLWGVGLVAGLGIAYLPLRRHQVKGEPADGVTR